MNFCSLLLLVALLLLWSSLSADEGLMVSKMDGQPYIVREDFENSQAAAEILASLNAMNVRMIKILMEIKDSTQWRDNIEFLANNYDPDVLGEHIPTNINYTSFVRDKGKKIRMCLRTPEDRDFFHHMNLLRYVSLHELTHMMIPERGHGPEFWRAFDFVLRIGVATNEVYVENYDRAPVNYCGLRVDKWWPLGNGSQSSDVLDRLRR